MTFTRTMIATVALALAGTAIPGSANAAAGWQHRHPARAEINHRIRHQEHRITQERREGDLTHAQAQALRAQDRAVLQQERADAQANGNHGHLNRTQVRTLNQELNANSHAIGH
jgi:Flp pilus assembly protein TadB